MRYRTGTGVLVNTDRRLGGGGEGDIFTVAEVPNMVAKVFNSAKIKPADLAIKRDKIRAMVGRKPDGRRAQDGFTVLAWPEDTLLDLSSSQVIGYLMPRLDLSTYVELHKITNSVDREELSQDPNLGWVAQFTYHHFLNIALNLCRALRLVHQGGAVVGDFNESNILVSNTTGVTIVDCDSMQFKPVGKAPFLCTVLKPEYSAPEVLQVGTRKPRSPESDLYVLALHMYTLMMDGSGAFLRGNWTGAGDRPDKAVLMRTGQWSGGPQSNFVTNRAMPPIGMLPQTIRDLFEQTLGPVGAGKPTARSTTSDWEAALGKVRLRNCSLNPLHRWPSGVRQCPWCELEQLPSGRAATGVGPTSSTNSTTQVHLPPPKLPTPSRPASPPPTKPATRPPRSPSATQAPTKPVGSRLPPASGASAPTPVPGGPKAPAPRPRVGVQVGRRVLRRGSGGLVAVVALCVLYVGASVLVDVMRDVGSSSKYGPKAADAAWGLIGMTPTFFVLGGAIACVGARFRGLPWFSAVFALLAGGSDWNWLNALAIRVFYPPAAPYDRLRLLLEGVGRLLPFVLIASTTLGLASIYWATKILPPTTPSVSAKQKHFDKEVADRLGTFASRDRLVAKAGLIMAATGILPWLIGLAITGHWWMPDTPGVDPRFRDGWSYAVVQYGSGLVVLAVLVALGWMISGRWAGRSAVLVVAMLLAASSIFLLRPAVAQAWTTAETLTARRQWLTPSQVPDRANVCASKTVKLTNPSSRRTSLWQAYVYRPKPVDGCTRLVIFEGQRNVKVVALASKKQFVGKSLMIVSTKSFATATVSVKDTTGNEVRLGLAKLR